LRCPYDIQENLQSISDGDLSIHLEEDRSGEVGIVSRIINALASQLGMMVNEMKSAATDMTSTANNIARAGEQG